jgi:hypothetical protein
LVLPEALAQRKKQIYPVGDSASYITPYTQRDHAWNDAQYNQSNEVTWSGETNTTAADHLDWVANDGGRLAPAAAVLAQQKWIPFHDHQSHLAAHNQSADAWTHNQVDKSNETAWKAHIAAVGADYLDSAETASETITDNANPLAALVQKNSTTYPVKDSHSYIDPYTQRDHSWNDAQHNQSNEVAWSKETNTTAADHIDHVKNEGPSRLVPAAAAAAVLAQQKQ